MRKDTVRTDSGCGSCRERSCHSLKLKVWKEPSLRLSTTWAWPWNNSVSARRAVQMWTACQGGLSTSTCWLSTELISDPTRAKLHKPLLPVNALGRFKPAPGRRDLVALHRAHRGPGEAGNPSADSELFQGALNCWRLLPRNFDYEPDGKDEGESKRGTASYPRNAACTAFIACSPLVRSTTTEILISLVEIISMLIPSRARVSNILPATPVWLFIPTPTMDSLAILSVAMTWPKPTSGLSPSMTFCALSRSGLSTVNERSVAGMPLPWLMFCTIISTFTLASPMALKMRAATPGLSGTATSVTFAWFLSSETPRTTMSSMFLVSSFTMVPGFSLRLERTSNTTPNFLANSTERDCMTFAPRLASSSISS